MFNNYYGNKKDDRCNDSCNRNKKDYGFYYGRIDDDCNHKKNDDEYNCKKDKCDDVLRKYHCMIKEAMALYDASNNIVDKEVAGEICDALKALIKAFELKEKADKKVDKANDLLDKSNCDKKFNKKLCKCEGLLDKADEAFKKKQAYLCKAGDLLEAALEAIKESVKFRNKGNNLIDAYVDCIHHKEEKKDCCCPNPIEKCYK